MKKRIFLVISSLFLVLIFTPILALSARGTWNSKWLFDRNGYSEIGTGNASSENGHFSLRVIRGDNQWIGNRNVVLGPNQQVSAGFWGQPFLDRKGQVIIAARYYHSPWFNP